MYASRLVSASTPLTLLPSSSSWVTPTLPDLNRAGLNTGYLFALFYFLEHDDDQANPHQLLLEFGSERGIYFSLFLNCCLQSRFEVIGICFKGERSEMRRMDNWNPYGAGPCQLGNIVPGVFTPVLAKHSKSFSLIDCISVGVDRMQRNFEPMRKQVEAWQRSELTDVTAKVVIYEAFVEGKLEAPKHLARTVHDLYFLCGAEIYVALASDGARAHRLA